MQTLQFSNADLSFVWLLLFIGVRCFKHLHSFLIVNLYCLHDWHIPVFVKISHCVVRTVTKLNLSFDINGVLLIYAPVAPCNETILPSLCCNKFTKSSSGCPVHICQLSISFNISDKVLGLKTDGTDARQVHKAVSTCCPFTFSDQVRFWLIAML